jgi:hypothetical protein
MRFTSIFDFITDPIWVWYFWGAVAFVVALIVGYFLPFKWVRAGLGGTLVLIGAFIAGGRVMHGEMKAQVDDAKAKAKIAKVTHDGDSHWPSWF